MTPAQLKQMFAAEDEARSQRKEIERSRDVNPATKYKNRYKKKRFVSLPKITMPMGDEE